MTDGNEKACRTLGKTTIYDIMERTLWEQDKILHYVPPGREENPYLLASGYKQILDDWFAYLNAGVALTALAGSDSHTKIREEPGVCRNYLRFSTDQPMLATDQEVAGRIWDHQATVSYGPFVEFTASGGAVGSVISDSDGEVNLHVRVETPGWFGVDRIEIYGNGLLIGEIDRDKSVSPDTGKRRFTPWGPGEPKTFEEMACYTKGKEIASEVVAFDEDITCLVDRDTWFVIITMGRQDMFPLYTSNEYPYIQIGALISIAIGSIGLPLPADLLGKNPSTMFAVHPYAMTNPIWVDHDGNGLYDPVSPGPPLPYSRAGLREEAQFIRDLKSHDWAASRAILNRAPLR